MKIREIRSVFTMIPIISGLILLISILCINDQDIVDEREISSTFVVENVIYDSKVKDGHKCAFVEGSVYSDYICDERADMGIKKGDTHIEYMYSRKIGIEFLLLMSILLSCIGMIFPIIWRYC